MYPTPWTGKCASECPILAKRINGENGTGLWRAEHVWLWVWQVQPKFAILFLPDSIGTYRSLVHWLEYLSSMCAISLTFIFFVQRSFVSSQRNIFFCLKTIYYVLVHPTLKEHGDFHQHNLKNNLRWGWDELWFGYSVPSTWLLAAAKGGGGGGWARQSVDERYRWSHLAYCTN